MQGGMSLAALQRDFRSWLVAESADAAAQFGERAQSGLGVYLNNYRGQLMACLAESFPAVRSWLGDSAFEGACATHIDRRPPHGWTLDAYAIEFPDTLDVLYGDDPEVAELARLERDLGLAFVGRDSGALSLSAVAVVDWDNASLAMVPTFSLLSVTTNAIAIWSAIREEQTPPAAAMLDEPAVIAIWRKEYSPTFRTLDPVEARAIFMASDGRPFGAICAAVVHEVGEIDGPQVAGSLLGRWITEGMIDSITCCYPCSVSQPTIRLPVIDVAARSGLTRATAARLMDAAASEYGFFYIIGHGIAQAGIDALIAQSRTFFSLDVPAKERIHMSLGGRAWRGWFPVGGELTSGRPDLKEGVYFGEEIDESDPRVRAGLPLHGRNLFPGLPGFRDAVLEYMEQQSALGQHVMALLALGLGLPA